MKTPSGTAPKRALVFTGILAMSAIPAPAVTLPQITSPVNGATVQTAMVDIQVTVAGIPDVQSVKIRSNGTVIGTASPTSYFGEWSFPDTSHISILEGTDGTAVKIDYTPPNGAPMFLIDGTMTSANTATGSFIHWPGGGVTNTGDLTATFAFANDGTITVTFDGDSPLGKRTVTGGISQNTTYHFVWNHPPGGSQTLTAVATWLNGETPEDLTSAGVTITVVVPKAPEIVVQQPKGSGLTDGSGKKSFGTVKVGKSGTPKVFTIKNTGTAKLTGLEVGKNGANAKDFTVGQPGKSTLSPGASTTFEVVFKPRAKGERNAAIHIKSNDADENPFDIKVTGQGAKP